MNLRNLTDQCLLDDTKKLVLQERQLITNILDHLAEVQRRRLFCQLGCSSLFAYCTEILRYSEYQAQQKISAMRLMLEVPELEKKLEKGEISLTNAAQAQTFFRQEVKSKNKPLLLEQKKKILQKLECTSTRQGQRILLSLSTQPKAVTEKERPVSADLTEIKFAADNKLLAKLKKLKGLMAHKKSDMNYSELINELCELGLAKLDPVRKAERAQKKLSNDLAHNSDNGESSSSNSTNIQRAASVDPYSHEKGAEEVANEITLGARSTGASESYRGQVLSSIEEQGQRISPPGGARNRRIPASVRHQVWLKAKGVCENCGSLHALQLDHKIPYALGGSSDAGNLRVLCRSCNQRAAIVCLGLEKMERRFSSLGGSSTHREGGRV